MLARTPQSFRDLNGCRKTTGKGFGRGRNKPRGPPREATGGHARGGYRGTHAQALRPRPVQRGPGPRPGPLIGSSTHQELEHVVDNRERRVSPPWAGPSLPPRGRGAEPTVDFRGTPRPSRASPRPSQTSPGSPSRRPGAPLGSSPGLPPKLADGEKARIESRLPPSWTALNIQIPGALSSSQK